MAGVGIEDLYESAYPRLVAQVAAVVGDRALAEDAVQEGFVRLLARWRRISSYDDPAAWVRRVALRVAIDRHRKESRDRPGPGADPTHHDRPRRDYYPSDSPLPPALATLWVGHREVLVLQAVTDGSMADLAAALGVPIGTAKSRLSRARRALADQLEAQEADHA